SLNDPNAKPQQGAAAEDVSVAPSLSEDTSSEPPLETSASENEILEEATPLPEVSQVGEAQEDSEEVSQLLADISKGLEKHRTPEAPSETTEAPVDAGSTEDLLASLFDGDSSESGQVPEELQADQETEEESVEVAGDEEVETSEAESDFVNHDLIAEVLGDTSIPWAGGEQASDSFEANEETPVQSLEVAEPMLAQEEESTNEQQNVAPVEEEVLMETPTEAILPEEEKVVEVQASAPKALEATQSVPVPEPKSTAPEPKSTTMSQSTTVDQEAQKLVKSEKAPLSKSSIADSSLRVDVELLDSLMNLVGELVLARNQILQFTKMNGESNANFTNTCQRLNLITSELQEGVMKTRMQPIANVWNKFPRIIRDIARACGKEIQVDMEGKDTDLDKTILEAIKDPLTHIVRNAADHGIETPEVREANGKSREGTLLLSAYHEGGHVIIEIVDDGAGLNTERIREKAIEKGVISAEKAGRMSEQELQRLIFAPGFSTAEQVTNISGRGVGMDVVRSNIEKIGGSVDIQSILGEGTTLKIKIPLTLAIVPALMISAGDQRFAIPQVSLLELLRIEGDKIDTQIEEIHGSLFYRLRGDLLPLVYLSHELQMTHLQLDEEARKKTNKAINVVVVRADEKEFGLVVDVVHDTEEIVVKPLGRQLKNIEVFAGATILGDGKVALILDILGLGKKAH
ncbi:MAG: chemotaxis protein CheA, partial [Bdellovibrionales bacterium]|nr:chemotaxis protein CheA [Bdellovibrionales bacterium]